MLIRMNEHRIEFKKVFITQVAELKPNDFISDQSLETVCIQRKLDLSSTAIKQCIRELEPAIGKVYKVRLQRLKSAGYVVLEALDQSNLAVEEGSKKLRRVCKRTSKRLGYVDINKLPDDAKSNHINKKMAFDSLAAIANCTVSGPKLTKQEVLVIDSAVNELKALEAFRKAGI